MKELTLNWIKKRKRRERGRGLWWRRRERTVEAEFVGTNGDELRGGHDEKEPMSWGMGKGNELEWHHQERK